MMCGAAYLANPVVAVASDDVGVDMGLKLMNVKARNTHTGQLGTATGSTDPETIWVGYWSGANQANNYWKVGGLPAGSGNRPGTTTEGIWTFEPDQYIGGDSLSGWWTIRNQHTNASGAVRTDENRPWWAVAYGNIVNSNGNPGGGTNRTFGVTGMWHRDAGSGATQSFNPTPAGANPHNPSWSPLEGSFSAWMGMRAESDVTYTDPVTGNAYNAAPTAFLIRNPTASGATDRLFPGYIGDMDQMLYRNIDMSTYAGGGMSVKFTWRTDMSTDKDTAENIRTGWHEGDVLSQNNFTPGNFVSAEAGTPANAEGPIDSMQVYIGSPVEGEWKSSLHPFDGDVNLVNLGIINGTTGRRIVQDPNRRWFNEVLEKDARLWLFGASGVNAVTTTTVPISHANVQALLDSAGTTGQSGKLRLVFRVHTNRTFDDASGSLVGAFSSGYAGAAVIDDVQYDIGAGFVSLGNFEAANSIDNNLSADAAWHSTGKPPGSYFHLDDVNTLVYEDICGPVTSQNRTCDLKGNVWNMGIHDLNEASTNPEPLSSEHEGFWGFISPTINLAGADQDSKDATKNNMNLTASERAPTDDYYFYYEMYTGYFDIFSGGQLWQSFFLSYPATQSDGVQTWSNTSTSGSLYYNPPKQCFFNVDGSNGLIFTSNMSGLPDSMRVGMRKLSECYRFGVTSGCSSSDGGYLDNLSFMIVDGTPQQIAMDIWDIFNDAFPANEALGLTQTPAFDTTTAHIKIGLNTYATTGDLFRYNVPGDSVTAQASGDSLRMDLMFRIRPGVGNYVVVGDPTSGTNDFGTGFFASYKGNPGTFAGLPGSINPPAAIVAHLGAPSGWNPIVWNSARMDTSEAAGLNTFPVQATAIGPTPNGNQWCSTYHEEELAARPTLGIARNRCFVIDTLVTNLNDPNVNCGSKAPYPPAWVTTYATKVGYNGSTTTTEGTKIIPDGVLTPGAHVQWFVRRQDFAKTTDKFAMAPDTTVVSPQNGESGNFDGHRWQEFSVLPDRWKDNAWGLGGVGMACMLFYDENDRRGDERVWKAVSDSIGATQASDIGGADGYGGVPAGTSVNTAAYFISNKNQQLGTLWDAYQMKASESSTTGATRIGQRLGYRATGFLMDDGTTGKWGMTAPTPDMLDAYYKVMLILTGDLNTKLWGPFADATGKDIDILEGWLSAGSSTLPATRGIMVIGDGFVEAANDQGPGPQLTFVTNYLATTYVDSNYLLYVPDSRAYVDVKPAASIDGGNGDIYGTNNTCLVENDIVDVNAAVTGAAVNLQYVLPDQSLLPMGVIKPHSVSSPWISQTISIDLLTMRGRFGATSGRLAWMYNMLNNVFGSVCTLTGTPVDVPGPRAEGDLFVNFMNLKNNPLVSGYATVNFGLAHDDFVQVKVFDVSGRLVRTLADRRFKAGEHSLVWDGADNGGRQLPRGVYFTQLRYRESGFELAKKLTILR